MEDERAASGDYQRRNRKQFFLRQRKISTTIEGFILTGSLTVRVATSFPVLPKASVGIIAQSGAVQCSSHVTTSSLVERGDKERRQYHWPLIILCFGVLWCF